MTKTAKRRYFNCPIQALYMMKEFEVEFECRNSDEEMQEAGLEECDRFYPLQEAWLSTPEVDTPETLEDIDFENFRKCYVSKESESIFVPQAHDIILGHAKEGRHLRSCTLCKDDLNSAWLKSYFKEIIMRNNKQFFTGEIEND